MNKFTESELKRWTKWRKSLPREVTAMFEHCDWIQWSAPRPVNPSWQRISKCGTYELLIFDNKIRLAIRR